MRGEEKNNIEFEVRRSIEEIYKLAPIPCTNHHLYLSGRLNILRQAHE